MKVYEILNLAQPMIEKMLQAGINPRDVQYLSLYNEFQRLKKEGHKIAWIVSVLADEYNVSQRTIYAIVKSFSEEIN